LLDLDTGEVMSDRRYDDKQEQNMTTRSTRSITIDPKDLMDLLEPLIRRVVREELAQVALRRPDVFYLAPDSPLRDDLIDILNRKEHGAIRLYSHAEVWNE
jgi:hypothetical protein